MIHSRWSRGWGGYLGLDALCVNSNLHIARLRTAMNRALYCISYPSFNYSSIDHLVHCASSAVSRYACRFFLPFVFQNFACVLWFMHNGVERLSVVYIHWFLTVQVRVVCILNYSNTVVSSLQLKPDKNPRMKWRIKALSGRAESTD